MNKREYVISQREIDANNINITSYANRPFLNGNQAQHIIFELISSNKPFFIGRIGETELRTISEYSNFRWLKRSCRIASHCICNNAGFFPNNPLYIYRFCKKYYESMLNIEYLGLFAWPNEEAYMEKSTQLKGCFLARTLNVFYCDNKWTAALAGKKVLIISPFADSIEKQYLRKNLIFSDSSQILPDFELVTLRAVQSIGGKGAEGFNDWFSALSYMETEINNIDFDIALLGCGAYGLPLGSYIKSIGKQAIVVGGCLQLLFGIMGKRWENDEVLKEYINKYWVRPAENEKPYLAGNVEDGCYW